MDGIGTRTLVGVKHGPGGISTGVGFETILSDINTGGVLFTLSGYLEGTPMAPIGLRALFLDAGSVPFSLAVLGPADLRMDQTNRDDPVLTAFADGLSFVATYPNAAIPDLPPTACPGGALLLLAVSRGEAVVPSSP